MYSRSAPRRRHSAEFKAKVLAACDEPGASVSGVALVHSLNANLVRQWRAGRGAKIADGGSEVVVATKASKATRTALTDANPEFVSVEMPIAKERGQHGGQAERRSDTSIHLLARGCLRALLGWPTINAYLQQVVQGAPLSPQRCTLGHPLAILQRWQSGSIGTFIGEWLTGAEQVALGAKRGHKRPRPASLPTEPDASNHPGFSEGRGRPLR